MDDNIGLTMRDWFAGQVLAGLMADHTYNEEAAEIAETCYEVADAMLKEREDG